MAMVKRGAVAQPLELAREVVAVAELGGEVAVVELDLGSRLEFEHELAAHKGASLVKAMVPKFLALCVLDADNEPLFDARQWQRFGARHKDVAIGLFNTGMRLSGLDAAANAKN